MATVTCLIHVAKMVKQGERIVTHVLDVVVVVLIVVGVVGRIVGFQVT